VIGIRSNDAPYLVPEKWAYHLDAQRAGLVKFTQTLEGTTKQLFSEIDRTSRQITTLGEEYMTLRSVINDRDSENKRLKRGYDRDLYARFLNRFIRLDAAINENQSSDILSRLSQDALDECGVERFRPEPGSDYRTLGTQVADHPKAIPTSNPAHDFLIAETLEPGYLLRSPEGFEVLLPSKVSIYRSTT
jgi:hypothetical protein